MRKFLTIMKWEYSQVVKKKSFLVGLLLTPTMMAMFTIVPGLFFKSGATSSEPMVILDQSGKALGEQFADALKPYKLEKSDEPSYEVKFVRTFAPDDSLGFVRALDSANQGIAEKKLKYAVVIGKDATTRDSAVYMVSAAESFDTQSKFEKEISRLLSKARLNASSINLGVDSVMTLARTINLGMRNPKGEVVSFGVKFGVSYAIILIMYMMILVYGSMVMRTVVEEKNSRIMEVLVSSVTPFQLMLGKILGLGLATLTAVAFWVVLSLGLVVFGGSIGAPMSPAVAALAFNPILIMFFVLFFVSGYILYSTFFALIGSIINNEREAQNLYFPIIISLMIPFIFVGKIAQEPDSVLSIVLSMIPVFAPTTMLMRLVFVLPGEMHYSLFSGIVLQAFAAFGLVVLATIGMIWITGRIFRIGILMYGKRPTLPELVKWLKY
jgi:ABC-2 type transport system permease protein